jgi:hypothetical protein
MSHMFTENMGENMKQAKPRKDVIKGSTHGRTPIIPLERNQVTRIGDNLPYLASAFHFSISSQNGRMAKGGHRLPKASLVPAKCYPSTPCGWDTSETIVSGVSPPKPGDLWQSLPLWTPNAIHLCFPITVLPLCFALPQV